MSDEVQTATEDKEETQVAAHEEAVNVDPHEPEDMLSALKEEPKSEDKKAEETVETSGEEEDTKTPEGEETTPTDQFDPEILSIAADLGVNEQQARRFSSVHNLELHLQELAAKEDTQPTTDTEKKEEEKPATAVHLEADDELDDEVVKRVNVALDKLTGQHAEQTKQLQTQIQSLQANQQQNANAAIVHQFDAMIAKHGDTHKDLLGEGSTFNFDPASKEWANRGKLLDEMRNIAQLAVQANRRIPGDEQLLARAVREVFGERSPVKSVDEKVEARQGQFLRRGSSKAPASPTKQQQALVELDEKLAAIVGGDG